MPIDAETEQRLRALAEAASTGPWEAWNEGETDEPPANDWSVLCEPIMRSYAEPVCEMKRFRNPENNAKFIAAANPAVVIALLDTVAELRRERDAAYERAAKVCDQAAIVPVGTRSKNSCAPAVGAACRSCAMQIRALANRP